MAPSPTSWPLLRLDLDSLCNLLEHFPEQVDRGPREAHDHYVVEDSEVNSCSAYQDLRHNRGKKIYRTEIVVGDISLLSDNGRSEKVASGQRSTRNEQSGETADDFDGLGISDSEIPF